MENQMDFVNITIQDHTGDRKLRLSWETGNSESARLAQERMHDMFMDLQKEGYRFFTCKKAFGIFPKKGREVAHYDPKLGELFYEAGEKPRTSSIDSTEMTRVVLEEIPDEEEKVKFEEPKKFDPRKEKADTSRHYVATRPMRAG